MRLIENTREHDINIQVGEVSVLVPAATNQPTAENGSAKVNGWVEMDPSDLEKAQKSPVIAYYFAEGWLVDSGDVAPAEEASTEEAPVRRKKGE